MPAIRRNFHITDETAREIKELAGFWGGVNPMPAAQVIREAVRRAHAAELGIVTTGPAKKKSSKKSEPIA
jgi:hypothetical protein